MQPEDIDKLFRDQLANHAPAPPTYLWDQLEEELQPAKKRPALWLWAAAAAVVLFLASGLLWLQLTPTAGVGSSPLATSTKPARSAKQGKQTVAAPEKKPVVAAAAQATPSPTLASTLPKEAPATAPLRQHEGVRSEARPQLTATAIRSARHNKILRPAFTREIVKPHPTPEAVAAATPKTQPERSLPPVEATPSTRSQAAMALVATPSVPTGPIEVEVLRTNNAPAMAATNATGPPRRSLGGILLRQARNAVRGERVSLAETGLPETVTVQARVGNRTLTKVIQL